MYQCINELWLYNSSNFALHYNYWKCFFQNIAFIGYLTQRWMASTVSILQKNFLATYIDPKQPKIVKFSLWFIIETFPRGDAWFFRESAKILRGGAKRSQGRCASPHSFSQNSAMGLSLGLHYQCFYNHSGNFASVNSKFWRICKKRLRELTQWLTSSQFVQTFLTNPSKRRIYTDAKFLLRPYKINSLILIAKF